MGFQASAPAFGFGDMNAALTYTTEPGGMRIDDLFQPQILDILRRRGVFGQRIPAVPATGNPSRYIEEVALPGNQAFVDPQNLVGTPGTPNRTPKSLEIKALIGQMDFSLFNVEVSQQQGQFPALETRDFNNLVDGMMKVHDKALWTGTSTGPTDSVGLQYSGYYNQLDDASNPFTTGVAAGVSIIDTFRNLVAQMMSDEDNEVIPTASYWHPLAIDFMEKEAKELEITFTSLEVTPGRTVNAIRTAAGDIPIIPDPLMGKVQITDPNDAYPVAIVTEPLIEYHYVTTPEPRVFELGLAAGLARKRVVLKFGAPVYKAADRAHALLKVADDWDVV